ncbi:hypothetical protein Lgra_0469 [Legionella gratiana]|uniref:Uncharacterized protein n=1 Tax=Legionella gratiana TaxID=45066 RepID=A0A378JHS7_9GAMM|nr:hypothetical protein [Legionella gratiana]KTD14766.1 hypothetical protein Lgra_0469 [Legionella gratiana]STX44230.1 Uncharacterised protein [Legionella gratiana]
MGIICIFYSAFAIAETNYICLPLKATGFKFNKYLKSWEASIFNIRDQKMLLKKTIKGWQWLRIGDKSGKNCGEINQYGYLFCSDTFGQLEFNMKSLRYVETYIRDYVNGDEDVDTPYIEIGSCSPI